MLAAEECQAIASRTSPSQAISRGTRCLLEEPWCAALAARLRSHPDLRAFIPDGHVAVQCTFFEKTTARNWLVPIHQDLSIPVARWVEGSELQGWSEKEGSLFVQPPSEVLERLVAVRLHLDACGPDDGPLRVVPGSHLHGRLEPDAAVALRAASGEAVCVADVGEALVMRPLLLHASSRASGTSRRRVLHFLYGPAELSHGLTWNRMV